jgi:hypothetical protein
MKRFVYDISFVEITNGVTKYTWMVFGKGIKKNVEHASPNIKSTPKIELNIEYSFNFNPEWSWNPYFG